MTSQTKIGIRLPHYSKHRQFDDDGSRIPGACRVGEHSGLRKLMRARKAATQSELINTLLAEEEERLRSHAVLRDTARTVRAADIDARLL